jgi:hypothetical protein
MQVCQPSRVIIYKASDGSAIVIYRIITEFRMIRGIYDPEQKDYAWKWFVPGSWEDQRMTGAGACFAHVMNLHGLRAPRIQNPRARFYFTERGWNQVGRFVAREAREKGFVMQVIRRKNPTASQIVYQDEIQIAILAASGWKAKD